MVQQLKPNTILQGDVLAKIAEIPDESIDCIVTSPPYWGLRDYKVEGQWGLEPTFNEWIDKMLKLTLELKRVLKKSGTFWLNIGDTYFGSHGDNEQTIAKHEVDLPTKSIRHGNYYQSKCLIMIPERLVLRMIDQGWILRNKIIWHKPNSMPASVRDRLKNSYEVVYLFVKNKKYYFDLDAIRVPAKPQSITRASYGWNPPERMGETQDFKQSSMSAKQKGWHDWWAKNPDKQKQYQKKFKKQDNVPSKNASQYEGFNQRWKERNEHDDPSSPDNFGVRLTNFKNKQKELKENKYGDDPNNLARKQAYMNEVQGSNIAGANPGDVWKTEEDEILTEYYSIIPTSELVNILNRSYRGIQGRANRLGLKKDKELVGELISKKNREYKLDETLFVKINSEQKAYWLGFLFADGYVSPDRGRIAITLKDSDVFHLAKLRDIICPALPLRESGNGIGMDIMSVKLAKQVKDLGMDTKEEIRDLPQELEHHFIRGLFDGDGSIYYVVRADGYKEYGWSLMGEKPLLKWVQERLMNNCDLEETEIRTYRNISEMRYGGNQQVKRIGKYLNREAGVYLERKFYKFPQDREDNTPQDLWTIATQPFKEAHFATFPEKLIEPMVLAGCPKQICSKCGFIRERITKVEYQPVKVGYYQGKTKIIPITDQEAKERMHSRGDYTQRGYSVNANDFEKGRAIPNYETIGWSSCSCNAEWRSGICLDPFLGSGTVAVVAQKLNRNWIGIELKESYIKLAMDRIHNKSVPLSEFQTKRDIE